MKIKLIVVGKTHAKYLIQAEEEYQRRLQHYVKFEEIILSDIKNTAKVGVQTGITWESTYPQTGKALYDMSGYEGPVGWNGATALDYWDYFGESDTKLLPVNPASPLSSLYNFTFPRGARFIHGVSELSPLSPSYRSLGLSSGRSFIRGVTTAIETDQKLTFVPASSDVFPNDDPMMPGGNYGWNGPVGAAHFVQTLQFIPFMKNAEGPYGAAAENWHCWITQLLPYSLGADTRAWITFFPDMGITQEKFGGEDGNGYYPPIPDMTGSNADIELISGALTSMVFQSANSAGNPEPGPPYLGPGRTGWSYKQQPNLPAVPTMLSFYPPFTFPVAEKTEKTLAKEYVYSSPYILFPEDRLVLGFQPAIGGGNSGAPKPINTPSLPFSVCDKHGYQGVGNNDYYKNIG